MHEMNRGVTFWLAWYREHAEVQEGAEQELPRRLLRLKMLHAASREEAQQEMQVWLEYRGLSHRDLERLEPSPYGLQFQTPRAIAL